MALPLEIWFLPCQCGFYANGLRCGTLAVSRERFEPMANWDDWSEATAQQLLVEYRQWVRRELSREGHFAWGLYHGRIRRVKRWQQYCHSPSISTDCLPLSSIQTMGP